MRPANDRRRYIVTSSPIGWAHSQNYPWWYTYASVNWALIGPGYDLSLIPPITVNTARFTEAPVLFLLLFHSAGILIGWRGILKVLGYHYAMETGQGRGPAEEIGSLGHI